MNANSPLVSVVIIFLNEERFLDEAIQSVFDQSFANWELILVDDGSTDRSRKIALAHEKRNPERVQYCSHPKFSNRGMSASRNLGIAQAAGRYVSFLDGDDVWLPKKLEQQIAILQSNPECVLVYGCQEIWHSWTGKPEDRNRDHIQLDFGGIQPDSLVKPPNLLTALLRNESVSPNCAMMSRDAIKAVGGYEENFRGMYEDQVLNAKLSLEAPVFASRNCWFRYRRHENSCVLMANKSGKKPLYRKQFLKWLEQYLILQKMERSEVWQVLQDELAACPS